MSLPQKLAITYYANVFVPIESKLSFLNNSRKYGKLEDSIKNCFIFIFNDDLFSDENLDFFLNMIFDYQIEYYQQLKLLTNVSKENEKEFQDIQRNFPLNEKIIELKKLLDLIDGTECSFVKNISIEEENTNTIENQEELLEDIFEKYSVGFEKYAEIINKYSVLGDQERNKLKLHTSDTFINEFHQFLTHYSYAQFAWAKQEDDKHTNFTNFINKNVDRAIKHLERAVLDIYKIISVILMRNEKDFKKQKFKIITNARNFEICNISNSLEDKIDYFIKIVEENIAE